MKYVFLVILVLALIEAFYFWKETHEPKKMWISVVVAIGACVLFAFFNKSPKTTNSSTKENAAKVKNNKTQQSSSSSAKKASSEKVSSISESKKDEASFKENEKNASAFLTDFNAYLTNKSAGQATVSESVVTVTMPDSVNDMSVADFKALAKDVSEHGQLLASGEDYAYGLIEFQTQSGTKLARTTLTGNIKIYNN